MFVVHPKAPQEAKTTAMKEVFMAEQMMTKCSGCHLAPGMKRTEISRGLYPRAPELRRGSRLTPAEEFWVVNTDLRCRACQPGE
jgi:hypothetical protein